MFLWRDRESSGAHDSTARRGGLTGLLLVCAWMHGATVGVAIAVGAWLYFTEGNMLYAGVAYMGYKRLYPQAAPPGGAPQAGGAPPAAQPGR